MNICEFFRSVSSLLEKLLVAPDAAALGVCVHLVFPPTERVHITNTAFIILRCDCSKSLQMADGQLSLYPLPA